MEIPLNLKINPSASFVGVLAELNGLYSGWSDGSYDWAAQTTDFLADLPALPRFDESLFKTDLSQRAIADVAQITLALLRGDYEFVRNYLAQLRFVFIIGYPRTGGSYLTKSIVRVTGLDHKNVPEPLAHDSYPNIMDSWTRDDTGQSLSYFYESFYQLAEFLVLSKLYWQQKTRMNKAQTYLVAKKIHKSVYAGQGFKTLFRPGQADYLLTIRNPLPVAISVYEKSGGLPPDGKFPAKQQRSFIEVVIFRDLLALGYSVDEIARLDYYQAVEKSWARFYSNMAISGLFCGEKNGIKIIPYDKQALMQTVQFYYDEYGFAAPPEDVYVHDKSAQHAAWKQQAEVAVATMKQHWASFGLQFPDLACL